MIALHTAAQTAIEQMVLSVVAGSAIAVCAGAALRLAPQHSSRTRFALWFAVLMSIVAVPLLAMAHRGEVTASGSVTHAWLTIPESWAPYIFAFWAVLACAGLARVMAGLIAVRRVRRSCEEISLDELPKAVYETMKRPARTPAPRRAVTLCVSDEVRVPAAIGFFRPVVVIPRWLFQELPAAELNQVVLHELAHLARWDDWTNLAQKTVRATLFFHPAVWWIDQRLSLEREMACDDAVIAATSDRRSYAQCLAMLAEKALGRRTATLAQAAVHRVQQVTARVMRILDPPSSNSRGRWASWMTAASTLVVAVAIAVNGGTSWVAFSAPETSVAQAATHSPVPSRGFVIPASMPLTRTLHPVAAVARHVNAKPVRQPVRTRMIAKTANPPSAASRTTSQPQANQIIPAKASLTGQAGDSSVMVLTVFSNSQGNVQYWNLTVYVPATTQAPSPMPRKTT